jgi:predicted nucleic acid-binding protein
MIVVADTSVFLNLGAVRQEHLLTQLYGDVYATPEVQREFVNAVQLYSRFAAVRFPDWVRVRTPTQTLAQLAPGEILDAGESSAIVLASELKADLLLVDEERGRRVARKLGLRTAGILAVLLDAKSEKRVAALKPLLAQLEQQARFFISNPLRQQVLKQAGE